MFLHVAYITKFPGSHIVISLNPEYHLFTYLFIYLFIFVTLEAVHTAGNIIIAKDGGGEA